MSGVRKVHDWLAIKIDDDTKARVKRLADARQRTSHWLMREAIMQYVDREEEREAFRQDTLKAWEDYRTTWRHATAEEVNAWLASWGSDDELPAQHATSKVWALRNPRFGAPARIPASEESHRSQASDRVAGATLSEGLEQHLWMLPGNSNECLCRPRRSSTTLLPLLKSAL